MLHNPNSFAHPLAVERTRMLPNVRLAVLASAASRGMHSSAGARGFMLSLERSVGDSAGKDAALRATNAFSAEVFPDLPIATTWENMWKLMRRPSGRAPNASTAAVNDTDVAQDKLKVMTVAANLRSLEDIEKRMRTLTSPPAAGVAVGASTTGRAADALLLVSGSHPVRTLPGSRQLLPTSLATLQLARRLRGQGVLPASTQLWAVANPNVERDASLAEQKIAQGAQVLLTQPPFDMESFSLWVEDARARGVLDQARLLVGHCMISSAGNLAFWLSLSGCVGRARCQELLRGFSSQEARDKAGMDQFCNQYNQQVTSQVSSWAGVGGFHLMPITPKGKKACIAAVQPGGMLADLLAGNLEKHT